jgi:hypothetical protein
MTANKPRNVTNEVEAATNPGELPVRKRGRPRVTPPVWDRMMSQSHPGRCRRTHVKYFHASRAIGVLKAAVDQDLGGSWGKNGG